LVGSVSDKGFSLDELVLKTRELFEREGMPGVVRVMLSLLDEKLALDLYLNRDGWRPSPCCDQPRYESHGRREKIFRTSCGEVKLEWRRSRCKRCGAVAIPLREFLGLEPYQTKTAELEREVMEVVSEQSYRRSAAHLGLVGAIPVPKSTLNRWVAQSGCDELSWPRGMNCLLADGTGYKRRPDPKAGLNNRGEVRVALGIDRRGRTVALGAWSGRSWEEIGEELQTRRGRRGRAGLLVSDGESGLAEGLSRLAGGHQRCHWHAVRGLNYTLWKEGADKEERDDWEGELAGILGVEIPSDSVEPVKEEERREVEERVVEAERRLGELASELEGKGYGKASHYVRRAKDHLFSHLRFWLSCGLIGPRTTSLIERMMREIGRRLKRIAFGWKEFGAAKMARIIIKRLADARRWEAHWMKKLRIDGKVTMVYRGISVK
jgi:hypothetical protein